MSWTQMEQSIPAKDASRLRNLFDASICSMEYGLGRDMARLSVTSFGSIDLPGVSVIRDEGIGYREGNRKPCHIAAHPSDDFLICIPHEARVRLTQCGTQTDFEAGNFSFLSTARPFGAVISAPHPNARFAHTIVRVSGPLLRQRFHGIDECCSQPIKIRPGAGRIMLSLLDLAMEEGGSLSDVQAQHFSNALIDAIADTAMAAPELALLRLNPASPAKSRLRERAQNFMLANLSNTELDAALIANHCRVSIRYLRAAFADSPHTIGSFIREARLQQCRLALQSSALAGKSVMQIAMSWGFADAAYFSRAYRSCFGQTPSETRSQALRLAG